MVRLLSRTLAPHADRQDWRNGGDGGILGGRGGFAARFFASASKAVMAKAVLWKRDSIGVVLSNLFLTSAFYALLPALPLYLVGSLHFSQGITGIISASLSISIVIIRPISGYLMDGYRRSVVMIASLFILALTGGV